jgi:flagellar biosynthesis repressor protein FlbT
MPLRIKLKPHERVIIGSAVVMNGAGKTELVIENNVPLLREKDVLTAAHADTPCKRIYLVVQLMYVEPDAYQQHNRTYWKLVRDVVEAAPSTSPLIHSISEKVGEGNFFAALKLCKKLIAYEQEVTDHVRRPRGR